MIIISITDNVYKPLREVEVEYEIDNSKCKVCKNKPCIDSCPINAIHQQKKPFNLIKLDENCFGCYICRDACPYDAINIKTKFSEPVQENIPNINHKICRICGACVAACRTGAIKIVASGNEEPHNVIDENICVKCGYCARACPTEAIKYGKILPQSVVGGKAININQKKCIGCMTCTRICPSKGAILISKKNKLPYINPSYCARCEECMNSCPSAAIKYSSRKRAYNQFSKMKTTELAFEITEKESEKLASEIFILDDILQDILNTTEIENDAEIDVTNKINQNINLLLTNDLQIQDFNEITDNLPSKSEIFVIENDCIGCGACIDICPAECINLKMPSPVAINDNCVNCGLCVPICPMNAIILEKIYFKLSEDKVLLRKTQVLGDNPIEIEIDNVICQSCGVCVNNCPVNALSLKDNKIYKNDEKCIGCNKGVMICPTNAIKFKI